MNKALLARLSLSLLMISFLFVGCSKNDPMAAAEAHLKDKVDYITAKAKVLKTEDFKITNIKKLFPKEKPMTEPWVAMITFTMVHSQEGTEIMKENFRVIFEFNYPYWTPTKMESEQIWRKNGQNVPWHEITSESNHDGWSMINSLLGLSGP
ncbi:MAG: hypothetical protein V4507_02550 [Verrucomicrobiota bacterium]